jgi:tripartite-type tricarboxylate transporter receptor subunit TctC
MGENTAMSKFGKRLQRRCRGGERWGFSKLLSPCAILILGCAVLFGWLAPAAAQDKPYPSRTVRLVVGFPPGGGVDSVARMFADKMTAIFGQPVVVVNHGGAAGGIAGKQVAAEEPDGYTVLVNSNSMVIYSLMNPKTGLVVERDLQAVASTAPQAIIIVTAPDVKANSLSELIELARTRPLNYGTPGSGSIPHLVIEQLLSTLPGVQMQNVPFQGASPALTAAMANQIDIASVTLPPAAPLVTAGKIKGIAVTSAKRAAALPQIPTAAESGYPTIVATAWTGFFVPPKTPKAVVDRLEQAILQVAAMPDIKEKLAMLGFEPTSTPGAQFRSELSTEIKTWTEVLERANLVQN